MKLAIAISLLVTLSACVATQPSTPMTKTAPTQTIDPLQKRLIDNPDHFRAFLSDTTVKTWNPQHGTQIEYYSPDGQTWLVYPGNQQSVRGEWRVEPFLNISRVCYRYGLNTYNPATEKRGGSWNCQTAVAFLSKRSTEAVDGDVLRLRNRGRYPQPLPPKTNFKISTVMKAIGLGELNKPNKFTWFN